MEKSEIWIGNDHAGYEMKLQVVEFLQSKSWQR